jgi:hypothetical protein
VLDHEISSCEPCYSWNIVNSWKTGDRAHFLEGMYALFTGAISNQTFVNCEHRHAMYGNCFVAPLMTWCVRQSVIDDQLAANELHLLRLVPLAWVTSREQTVFENMPTEYGPVDLKFRLSGDGKQLDVTFAGRGGSGRRRSCFTRRRSRGDQDTRQRPAGRGDWVERCDELLMHGAAEP